MVTAAYSMFLGRKAPSDQAVFCLLRRDPITICLDGAENSSDSLRDAFGVQMPDGRHVRATVRSAVVGQKDLPLSGNHIGDARYVAGEGHWYLWLIQSANSAPTWIDP
jgi:hypothetical protein